jgi:putative spermidine/putrescine transport system ATP-binding protein
VRTIMMLGHYIEMTVDTDYGIVKSFISDEQAQKFKRGDRVAMAFNHTQEYTPDVQ